MDFKALQEYQEHEIKYVVIVLNSVKGGGFKDKVKSISYKLSKSKGQEIEIFKHKIKSFSNKKEFNSIVTFVFEKWENGWMCNFKQE